MDQREKRPKLSVIGLGKLGSPMAAVLASRGYDVIGVDLNPAFVTAINEGRAPVQEPQLQEYIEAGRSRLRATADMDEAVLNSDVTFIIVPTPSGPDLFFSNKYILQAVERIGQALRRKSSYHLVVVTSTVMPGSTGGEIRAALERAAQRKVGPELGLCYNPEFIALGSVIYDMLHPDMILIGESDEKAGAVLETVHRDSTQSNPEICRMNFVNAELCKISVNTYVTTKISYANMIADMCDHLPGADAEIVTRTLGADSRIGKKYIKGAIGYGGPCFPRDNKAFAALGRALGVKCDLAEATDRINDHQIARLFGAVEARAEPGAEVAILGLSYKPQTGVIEESQGVALAKLLAESGYHVVIADPLAVGNAGAVLGGLVEMAESAEAAARRADVIVVTTPWPEFKAIGPDILRRDGRRVSIIDPWRLFDESIAEHADLIALGRGGWRNGTLNPSEVSKDTKRQGKV